MSWFDSFFSGGSWVAPLIGGAAAVGGALIAADANREASDKAAQAAREQAEINRQAAAASTAAIREGNSLAQQRFEQARADALPGLEYQRASIANAGKLTPLQAQQLDDVRRTTNNALAVSGLRGSGRAAVAAVRRSEADFTNRAIDDNRRRADAAASGLAQQSFRANEQAASVDAATGRAVGQGYVDGARATGQGALQAGLYGAESDLATAQARGRAIGDIGTIINDTLKEGRRSNYSRRPSEAV